jgi:hypothetical protein
LQELKSGKSRDRLDWEIRERRTVVFIDCRVCVSLGVGLVDPCMGQMLEAPGISANAETQGDASNGHQLPVWVMTCTPAPNADVIHNYGFQV